jgi:hypothetical protein
MYRSMFAGRLPPYASRTKIGSVTAGDAYAFTAIAITHAIRIAPQEPALPVLSSPVLVI